MLGSLNIGCLMFSLNEPTLVWCNTQAEQYLQTKNPKDIATIINLKALLLDDSETDKEAHSYTLKVGSRMFQLLVYPPDHEKQVTILLIPIDGPPRMLEGQMSCEEREHDMVFIIDEAFTVVAATNREKAHHMQVPPEYVLGKTIAQLVDAAQLDHWYLVFERAKATNAMQSLFYRTSKPVGYRFLKIVVQWEAVSRGYRVWVDDITSVSLASANTGVGFLIMDADSVIEYADAMCLEIFQKERSELLGSDIRTLFQPFNGGSFFDIYYSCAGSFPKLLRLTPFSDPREERPDYTIIQVADITTEGDVQHQEGFVNLLLQVTYRLLQASSENLDDVLTEVLQHLGAFCSADHLTLFQAEGECGHMSCTHWYSAYADDAQENKRQSFHIADYPNLEEAMKRGQEVYIASVHDLPDSWKAERALLAQYNMLSLLMEPILSGKKLLGFIGLDTREHDVQWTEQMRGLLYLFANILGAFFARIQSEQRLQVALAAADDLIEQRDEMNRSLQSFYAKINHDTRNSLNVIHASSMLLKHTTLDALQSRYNDTIESNSIFLLHLIRDLLDFSSFTDQPIVLHEQQMSLLDVVRNSVIAIRTLAEEKGLKVDIVWDRSIPSSVVSDSVRLSQVLINLLHNAVKFTTEGSVTAQGKLIDLKPDSVSVQLCVSDTGRGMDENAKQGFFAPQDSVPIPSFGEGYGLGLGIVKQLCKAFNGKLAVQSTVGEGTTFSLCLDLKLPTGQEPTVTPPGSLNILVVGRPSAAMSELLALIQADCACLMHVQKLPASAPKHMDLMFVDTELLNGSAACKCLAAYADEPPVFLYCSVFDQAGHENYRRSCAVAGYVLASSSPQYNRSEVLSKLAICGNLHKPDGHAHGMCVLVVDDSLINQELMRRHLQALDVEVLTTSCAAQALNLLRDHAVDLVLTDMQLPDLDGIALTERIRTFSDAKKRSVPVVLLSAFISEAIRQRSEAAGIVDYLLKPVEREDLAALLEKYHSGLVG